MFPSKVIYVPQLSLRKITDQSRNVHCITSHICGAVGTARYGIQNLFPGRLLHILEKKHINCVTYALDPAPAFELHRSRLLYFVDHKAWDGTYVDILSKAQKE